LVIYKIESKKLGEKFNLKTNDLSKRTELPLQFINNQLLDKQNLLINDDEIISKFMQKYEIGKYSKNSLKEVKNENIR